MSALPIPWFLIHPNTILEPFLEVFEAQRRKIQAIGVDEEGTISDAALFRSMKLPTILSYILSSARGLADLLVATVMQSCMQLLQTLQQHPRFEQLATWPEEELTPDSIVRDLIHGQEIWAERGYPTEEWRDALYGIASDVGIEDVAGELDHLGFGAVAAPESSRQVDLLPVAALISTRIVLADRMSREHDSRDIERKAPLNFWIGQLFAIRLTHPSLFDRIQESILRQSS
jgi:hypothetical protein